MRDVYQYNSFNSFLSRIVLFTFIALVSVWAIGFVGNKVSPLHQFEKERWDIFHVLSDKVKSIVIGNSHSTSLYFSEGEGVFYLNSPGEDILESLQKTKKVTRAFQVDVESSAFQRCFFINTSPLSTYYTNKMFNPERRKKFYYINRDVWAFENDHDIYLKARLNDIIRSDKWTGLAHGFSGKNYTILGNSAIGLRANKYYFFNEEVPINNHASARGNQHAKYFIQDKGKQVKDTQKKIDAQIAGLSDKHIYVFYRAVYPDDYMQYLDADALLQERNFYSMLDKKYKNVVYIDFMEQLGPNLAEYAESINYYNEHMNIRGAKKFTRAFQQVINEKAINCQLPN